MTRQELWAIFVSRNPSFEGEGNITLSKAGLRKLFDQTWDYSRDEAIVHAKPPPVSDVPPDFFDALFKGSSRKD